MSDLNLRQVKNIIDKNKELFSKAKGIKRLGFGYLEKGLTFIAYFENEEMMNLHKDSLPKEIDGYPVVSSIYIFELLRKAMAGDQEKHAV